MEVGGTSEDRFMREFVARRRLEARMLSSRVNRLVPEFLNKDSSPAIGLKGREEVKNVKSAYFG